MSDFTRISCPGFVMINYGALYGLVVDKEFHTGLMPVGGALHASAKGLSRIRDKFHVPASAFDPDAGDALRFIAPNTSVADIKEWFERRIERDPGSYNRLVLNSLYHEAGVLTRNEVASVVNRKFLGFSYRKDVTFRTNVWERDTLYMIEVMKYTYPPAVLKKLVMWSQADRSNFRLVTADQIEEGVAHFGRYSVRINPVSKSLLNPQMPRKNGRKRS